MNILLITITICITALFITAIVCDAVKYKCKSESVENLVKMARKKEDEQNAS